MFFNVLKKNRKYFAAKTQSGWDCKILIDSNSQDLQLGEHILDVEDISIRTKFGSDLKYKLKATVNEHAEKGIVTLVSSFNTLLADRCRELGGKWDREVNAWLFPAFVADEIEELDELFNSFPIAVEIIAKNDVFGERSPIHLFGVELCRAYSRDSGACIQEGVALITGEVTSCGSSKYWKTVIRAGSTLRLQVPSNLLKYYDDSRFVVRTVE